MWTLLSRAPRRLCRSCGLNCVLMMDLVRLHEVLYFFGNTGRVSWFGTRSGPWTRSPLFTCWFMLEEQNRPTLCDKQSVCGSVSNRVEKEAMCWKSEGEEEEELINSLESWSQSGSGVILRARTGRLTPNISAPGLHLTHCWIERSLMISVAFRFIWWQRHVSNKSGRNGIIQRHLSGTFRR